MSDRKGFTLIELLVVMSILVTLAGIGIWGIGKFLGRGQESAVENLLVQLSATIEAYQNNPRNGDYPPTVLDNDAFPGVGQRNSDNAGIESLVLCLHRTGQASLFDVEDIPWVEGVDNVDGDQTQVQLTTFGDRGLYEIIDPWGTPLVYFHHRNYTGVDSKGYGRVLALDGSAAKAKPWKNRKTKTWYRKRSFQIISAGPDLKFNTDDDITNFKR